jgi:predicted DNA-binding protein YlxM (UPF0122 family)
MPSKIDLDEKKIVELYKSGMIFTEIAKIFNVSKRTIRDRLRKNNIYLLPGRKQKVFLNEKDIINLYINGNSIQKICNKYNIYADPIRKILLKNKIMKPRGDYRRIEINDLIFSIKTYDSSYWAGFLAADGNVFGNTILIHLHSKDYKHLEKYKYFVKTNVNVIINKKSCYIKFRSNKIAQDLKENFNIVPNKSLILEAPNLNNDENIRHFIRGYFDGDGCFYCGKNRQSFEIYSGSINILKWILYNIKKQLKVNDIIKVRHKKNNVYRFSFGGKKDVINIMNWLYKDCEDNYLERKYNKFKSFMED